MNVKRSTLKVRKRISSFERWALSVGRSSFGGSGLRNPPESSTLTGHEGEDVEPLKNIRVVLVGPLYGGNVGAVCRAMANMGLGDLALVAPRPLNMDELRMMACHAFEVYERRREAATLGEAVADCGRVVGTTARGGLYRQHVQTPRAMAPRLLEAAAAGPAALVFGREDNGLDNEELALCSALVRIPTATAFASLNLAQAVMVCCHELFSAAEVYQPPEEKSPEASSALRERMFEIWRATLLEIGFMEPEKADHMMLGLRRILGRGRLTEDDVNILMGMARQSSWAARHGRSAGA
jgi:TrmH family RNA methyltransferase